MRIISCHSPNERCGIRQYGLALDESLRTRAEVVAVPLAAIPQVHARSGDALLVHFEPSLIGPELKMPLLHQLRALRASGVKVAFCCHWYGPRVAEEYVDLVDRFVVHRGYPHPVPKGVEIPLGCPTYAPSVSRDELRARFGFPRDQVVVTTVGFLTRWKRLPEVTSTVASMCPPNVLVMAQTPWPFDELGSGVRDEDARLRAAAASRVNMRVSTDFLSERTLLDLVHASDVGFVYHPIDTSSVSAATKQFISARCPLVVTPSSHSGDLHRGVHRVGSFDLNAFAYEVVRTASDEPMRQRMRVDAEAEYRRINMDAVAQRYVEEFSRI